MSRYYKVTKISNKNFYSFSIGDVYGAPDVRCSTNTIPTIIKVMSANGVEFQEITKKEYDKVKVMEALQ